MLTRLLIATALTASCMLLGGCNDGGNGTGKDARRTTAAEQEPSPGPQAPKQAREQDESDN